MSKYIPGIYLVYIQYILGIYQVYTLTLVYTRYIPGIYCLYDYVGNIGGIYHTKTSISSIYMWAYTGENILSALPSKIFPGVISHLVSKGGIQGFSKKNDY